MESFRRTTRIDVGSAVVSILASGGPIAQAEGLQTLFNFYLTWIHQESCMLDLALEDLNSWLGLTV